MRAAGPSPSPLPRRTAESGQLDDSVPQWRVSRQMRPRHRQDDAAEHGERDDGCGRDGDPALGLHDARHGGGSQEERGEAHHGAVDADHQRVTLRQGGQTQALLQPENPP